MQEVEQAQNVLIELPVGKRIMLRMSIVVIDDNKTQPLSEVPSLDEVTKLVSTHTTIPVDQIRSSKRTEDLLYARMLLVALATTYDYSSKQLGRYLNRNHSSILHSIGTYNDLLSSNDERLLQLIDKVQPQIPFTIKAIARKKDYDAQN
jgi:chromosomal replication initiation ATPase DnaA